MTAKAQAAYRRTAFAAVETCPEADGALHWRPEVIVAVASHDRAPTARSFSGF